MSLNKAHHYYATGNALCDECGKPVEKERVIEAKGIGPFLCKKCIDDVMNIPFPPVPILE